VLQRASYWICGLPSKGRMAGRRWAVHPMVGVAAPQSTPRASSTRSGTALPSSRNRGPMTPWPSSASSPTRSAG